MFNGLCIEDQYNFSAQVVPGEFKCFQALPNDFSLIDYADLPGCNGGVVSPEPDLVCSDVLNQHHFLVVLVIEDYASLLELPPLPKVVTDPDHQVGV